MFCIAHVWDWEKLAYYLMKKLFEHFAEILWKTATLEGPTTKLYKYSIIKENNLLFPEDYSLGEGFFI